jgi:hypothetical protein
MVLGFYYLTIEKYAYQKGRGLVFSTLNDVLQAYELGSIDLHSQIWLKWYGPFTGDSNSRLTNPQKHEKRALESIIPRFVDGVIQQNPKNSNLSTEGNKTLVAKNNSSSIQKQFQNSIYRFKREADQPIEIRINKNGIATKIYSSYQWQQDAEGKYRGAYIRTTPGRVLMNQIFQTFA